MRPAGQAMIIVLFLATLTIVVISQVVVAGIGTINLTNQYFDGQILLTKAEGYLESGALRLLRDPTYDGESLQDGSLSCTIQINNIESGKDIETVCQKGSQSRKVGLTVSSANGIYNFSKMEERE